MNAALLIPGLSHINAKPDFTRLSDAVLRSGRSDRLPFLELFADAEVKQAILGRQVASVADETEFWLRLGYDSVPTPIVLRFPISMEPIADTAGELASAQRSWMTQRTATVTTWEAFEKCPWPKVNDDALYYVRETQAALPEGMGMLVESSGVLENVMWLMGYEGLSMALYDNPKLVQAMFDRVGELLLECYEATVDFEGVGGVFFGEDMGFKTSTMISPEAMRRYQFPWLKRIVKTCHDHGKFVVLHSCGNLEGIMDDLIDDVGIDAKHSYEDAIEPVASFKKRYGDRIGVVGGVDVDALTRMSVEEIRPYVRNILDECAPGGGYALGSGNSVTNYIRVENYLAMLEEGWRYREGTQ